MNVIPGEECVSQHKLLVGVMAIKQRLNQRKATFVSRCKTWKLREACTKLCFQQEVSRRANSRVEDNVVGMWKGLKECLLEVLDEVCGRTKGPTKRRQTW